MRLNKKLKTALSVVFLQAISGFIKVSAQLHFPNSSFESGTGSNADSWVSTNSVERVEQFNAIFNNRNVTLTPPEGQYFLKLTTTNNPNDPANPFLAKASITLPFIGYPDSVVMFASYFPQIPQDYYVVSFDFLKVDSATQYNAIVLGMSFNGNDTGNWNVISRDFSWPLGKPDYDSLRISLHSANQGQHDPQTGEGLFGIGTVLLVDDMTFYGQDLATKTEQIIPQGAIKVYPNPCKNKAFISLDFAVGENAKLTVTDISGRVVKEMPVNLSNTTENVVEINMSGTKPGIYTGVLNTADHVYSFKLTVME